MSCMSFTYYYHVETRIVCLLAFIFYWQDFYFLDFSEIPFSHFYLLYSRTTCTSIFTPIFPGETGCDLETPVSPDRLCFSTDIAGKLPLRNGDGRSAATRYYRVNFGGCSGHLFRRLDLQRFSTAFLHKKFSIRIYCCATKYFVK